MRGEFFAYLGMGLVCLAILYCVYAVLRSLYSVFADMWQNRELDKLAVEYARKRDERKEYESTRLKNGCEHQYGDPLGALPEGVCNRCGLAKDRPMGACDHVWRILPGPIPESQCEKCEKKYSTVEEEILE